MQRRLIGIMTVVCALLLVAAASAGARTIPGSIKLQSVQVKDPFGGPDYAIATYRQAEPAAWCTAGFRIKDGDLGQVNPLTGVFKRTTLDQGIRANPGPCGGGLPLTSEYTAAPDVSGHQVTEISAYLGAGITSVSRQTGDGWKPVSFSDDGVVLIELAGAYTDEVNPDYPNVKLLPLVRVTATLCGSDARNDLVRYSGARPTGSCEATMYIPNSGAARPAGGNHRRLKGKHSKHSKHHKK